MLPEKSNIPTGCTSVKEYKSGNCTTDTDNKAGTCSNGSCVACSGIDGCATYNEGCATCAVCESGMYLSNGVCVECPAVPSCGTNTCCELTGPNDVCGRPTAVYGNISEIAHSDLNADGCCVQTAAISCSLNPTTARTCTQTCGGTCNSGECVCSGINGCLLYALNCSVCTSCSSGTYLSGNTCVTCPTGNTTCSDTECCQVKSNTPSACSTLYDYKSGNCTIDSDRTAGTCSNGACNTCSGLDGCKTYKSGCSSCSACIDNYYLSSGTCISCDKKKTGLGKILCKAFN